VTSALPELPCRSCGEPRPLDEYRLFRDGLQMDFCVWCERAHGTLTLYRRFSSYGTPKVMQEVFSAERTPPGRRSAEQVRLLIQPAVREEPKNKEELLKRELQRRELARRKLIYFTTTFDSSYQPGWVHQDIARRLERFMAAIERGESPRLALFMPPRAGKSRMASDMFPSWVLGHHPEWPIIAASYGLDLPVGFSRLIRDRIKDPEYQAIFEETRMRPDTQGVENWMTTRNGGYLAAGVGVGISGKGMMLGILDDPIKDFEASQSETIRDSTWGWYQSVFRTRAAPGAGILLIQTRWHDLDVAGRLLDMEKQQRDAGIPDEQIEHWEVVSYPALAEHDEYLLSTGEIWCGTPPEDEVQPRLLRRAGEALHPERYSTNDLLKLKHGMAPAIWSALYQQNPTPDDGDYFKRSDFRYGAVSAERAKGMVKFLTVDYAIGKRQRNDWTVMGVHALMPNNERVTLAIRRGRWQTFKLAKTAVELIKEWKPDIYAGEQGQLHAAIWPVIKAELEKEELFISVNEDLAPVQDKEARARPLQAMMQMGKWVFGFANDPKSPPVETVERELLRFPTGTHDDIVDMLAWAARLSQTLTPNAEAQPPVMPSWRDELEQMVAGGDGSFMAA
jgi:hypothetical protein